MLFPTLFGLLAAAVCLANPIERGLHAREVSESWQLWSGPEAGYTTVASAPCSSDLPPLATVTDARTIGWFSGCSDCYPPYVETWTLATSDLPAWSSMYTKILTVLSANDTFSAETISWGTATAGRERSSFVNPFGSHSYCKDCPAGWTIDATSTEDPSGFTTITGTLTPYGASTGPLAITETAVIPVSEASTFAGPFQLTTTITKTTSWGPLVTPRPPVNAESFQAGADEGGVGKGGMGEMPGVGGAPTDV